MPRKEVTERRKATRALRAVKPGEAAKKAAPKKPLTVTEALATGSTLDFLEAMSRRISQQVDDPHTPARDLAPLTRRLHELAKDIAVIKAALEDDEIADAADTPDEAFDGTAGV